MKPPYIGISRGPMLDYPHTDGRAVIGGYVYRGKEFAHDLGGKYIFGDNVFRTIWALDETATPVKKTLLCVMPKGTGPNSGTDYTGLVLVRHGCGRRDLFLPDEQHRRAHFQTAARRPAAAGQDHCRSCFRKRACSPTCTNLQPADFLIPYTVNSPLWSDGAVKTRWFALPDNTVIGFSANGEWTFPAGTRLRETFCLAGGRHQSKNPPPARNAPARPRHQRLRLWRELQMARGQFRRRPGHGRHHRAIEIKTADGTRTQKWFYPGRQDCLTCHTPASGGVLGVKTRQLNGDFKYPNGVTDNQLHTLGHLGIVRRRVRRPEDFPLPAPRQPHEHRRRAADCASAPISTRIARMCHRPGGVGRVF